MRLTPVNTHTEKYVRSLAVSIRRAEDPLRYPTRVALPPESIPQLKEKLHKLEAEHPSWAESQPPSRPDPMQNWYLDALGNYLKYHQTLYYQHQKPTITDYQFDTALNELLRLEQKHPNWVRPGTPTNSVGY